MVPEPLVSLLLVLIERSKSFKNFWTMTPRDKHVVSKKIFVKNFEFKAKLKTLSCWANNFVKIWKKKCRCYLSSWIGILNNVQSAVFTLHFYPEHFFQLAFTKHFTIDFFYYFKRTKMSRVEMIFSTKANWIHNFPPQWLSFWV